MSHNKQTLNHLAERFEPSFEKGLSSAQVALRQQERLTNSAKTDASLSYAKIIAKNLFTFFNFLCAVCVVCLLLVKAPISDLTFAVVFGANLFIGIFQEIRAKIALQKLNIVSSPTAIVVRGGVETEINIDDIVLDDVIKLSLGSQIPCDCVLLQGNAEVNESLLTGESVPVKKQCGDSLLGGSFVVGGTCFARADKIGTDSYVQQLSLKAKLQKSTNSKLLNAMNAIIKTVGVAIFPIGIVMAIINYGALSGALVGETLIQQTVIKTSTVVIGMIPSGLFLLTTMALFVGILNLTKVNTHVKELYSLEMLARVDVLCLDKTGTITDGNMVVKELIDLDNSLAIPNAHAIYAMQVALCDNNQTAIALRDYFHNGTALDANELIPFSSDKKYSAVSFEQYGTYVLGAPNYVFKNLDDEIAFQVKKHASLGRRILVLAHSPLAITNGDLPQDVKPVALIVIEDNIRPEAIETIKYFMENGVEVKVISGDDPLTVSEIAKRAGIVGAEKYINLDGKSNEELFEIADKYTVFGRVSPEQKATLVKALKKCGHTVAMTGDGVNDILAMKEADCSVTVASGSSAAKSVAHLILLDNNFNSLPKVVTEGRRVINNIQRTASLFLVKTIFTAINAIIAIINGSEYPFSPTMMVMFEVFIIGLPAFFLSLQPNNERVEGNFILQVFANAIPGALAVLLNIYGANLVLKLFFVTTSPAIFESMQVAILTFGGWAFLIALCRPFDVYKGSVLAGVSIIIIAWLLFFMDTSFFRLAPFLPLSQTWQVIVIMAVFTAVDVPVILGLKICANKLFNKLFAK